MSKPLSFSVLLAGLALTGPARAAEPALARYAFSERHMGTMFQVIFYARDETAARDAAKAAFRRIAALDGIMSDYKETSELILLCKNAGGKPVHVGKDLFAVLSKAQEVSRLSHGAFDVTVGPVVRLWRRARRTKKKPERARLAMALALVGHEKVKLDAKAHTIQLAKQGMLLDLGGIAKGYTADAVLDLLKERGINRALVAAGGDIAVSDAPPDAKGWKIGIAPLANPDDKPKRFLILSQAAVSTSGDYEQHVTIAGKRYSHIVDPRTGIGLVGQSSVTVVAPKGVTADSLTKVVAVLGPKEGFAIIDKLPGVSSYVVRLTVKGEEEIESRTFARIPMSK